MHRELEGLGYQKGAAVIVGPGAHGAFMYPSWLSANKMPAEKGDHFILGISASSAPLLLLEGAL